MPVLLVRSELEQVEERQLAVGALDLGIRAGEGSWISGSSCFVLDLCICLFLAPLNKLASRLLWVLISHFFWLALCLDSRFMLS